MNHNTMDSNRTEPVTISSSSNNEQQGYQSITFRSNDFARYAYLSIFPSKVLEGTLGVNDHLFLLANVPNSRLGPIELQRRQQASVTTSDTSTSINNDNNDGRDPFCLSSEDVKELSTRLQVQESVIECNADRLRPICHLLLGMYESFGRNVLEREDITMGKNSVLNSKQISLLLEFYLQIDVDVFYMKTCRFRGAEPSSTIQGLFCNNELPQARYSMIPCRTNDCQYCHSMENRNQNSSRSTIDFEHSSQHRFANGYTTYLNCPATCTTSNIIYVMTCPCGQYEFIDSTSGTLVDALSHHRLACNQMIHSYLTGSPLYYEIMTTSERYQHYIMRQMRLYQHSAHCPVALRLFLDRNPNYWCFIPMLEDETSKEDDLYMKNIRATCSEIIMMLPTATEHQQKVADLLYHVPSSSTQNQFSRVQLHEQRLFFDRFLKSPVDELPYIETDLYQMKMIAVLPTDESIVLRYLIETLFIVHAETKLNMICPIGLDPKVRYGLPYDLQWKSQMPRPTLRSTEFVLSIIGMIKELNRRPSNNPE